MITILPLDILLEIHGAATALGLAPNRAALLGGLDPVFVSAIPDAPSGDAQLLNDLHALNDPEAPPAGGLPPFEVWLTNALALRRTRSESAVFRRSLGMVRSSFSRSVSGKRERGGPAFTVSLLHANRADAADLARFAAGLMDVPFAEAMRWVSASPPDFALRALEPVARRIRDELHHMGAVAALVPETARAFPVVSRGRSGLLMVRVPGDAPFMLMCHPVTQRQYRSLTARSPSRFQGDERPLESVSWDEATAFGEAVSEREGRRFRLPTEAEWERAARADDRTAYAGSGRWQDVGWACDNTTHDVCKKLPNGWGLYDLSGNVQEWVADRPGADDLRIAKGGSYASTCPDEIRIDARVSLLRSSRSPCVGFRLACDAEP